MLSFVEDAKAKIGAAISAANWQSVFFDSDLSIVTPLVTKSSCYTVAMMAATFDLKELNAVLKAGTVATIAALSSQCCWVALYMLSFASCVAFITLHFKLVDE